MMVVMEMVGRGVGSSGAHGTGADGGGSEDGMAAESRQQPLDSKHPGTRASVAPSVLRISFLCVLGSPASP